MQSYQFWKEADYVFGLNKDHLYQYTINDEFRTRIDRFNNPFKNYVTYVNTDESSLDDILSKIKVMYENVNSCAIYVRKKDRPENLKELLLTRNWIHVVEIDHLILDLTTLNESDIQEKRKPIKDTRFKLRKVSNKEISQAPMNKQFYDLHKNGFAHIPLSLDSYTKTFMNNVIEEEKGKYNTNFVYFIDNRPISMTSIQEMGTVQDKRIALLGGAVTHKEFQGNGLYSSLLIERILDAKKQGIDIITTDARNDSSSPIIQKFGFKKVDTIDVFVHPSWNANKNTD